jgi:hypothetical protein
MPVHGFGRCDGYHRMVDCIPIPPPAEKGAANAAAPLAFVV